MALALRFALRSKGPGAHRRVALQASAKPQSGGQPEAARPAVGMEEKAGFGSSCAYLNRLGVHSRSVGGRGALGEPPPTLARRAIMGVPRGAHPGNRSYGFEQEVLCVVPQSLDVVFEPFSEVKPVLKDVENKPAERSLARHRYGPQCERALNEQINVEYTLSTVYFAMYAFFNRDNVGLPGFARYFNDESLNEREHAMRFAEQQNLRGGRVKAGLWAPRLLACALSPGCHECTQGGTRSRSTRWT